MNESTSKDQLESMCRRAGVKPALRTSIGDLDLLIAEGFSLAPHKDYWERFGLERWDYPGTGCHIVLWLLAKGEEQFFFGRPLFFDGLHNPEWDAETKIQARRNQAIKDAESHVKRIKAHGRSLH